MKSRLALTMVIAAGFMLSTTGATLAITGSSGSGSAAENQYSQVLPESDEGGNKTLGADTDSTEAQPSTTEQVEVAGDSGSLPFTGFVAIPLLIIGVVLLSLGAILRRRTGHQRADS